MGKYKREHGRSGFLLAAMINSEQRLSKMTFFKLCNLCNHLVQLPCRINSHCRKGRTAFFLGAHAFTSRFPKKDFLPYSCISNLSLHLRSLSPVHRPVSSVSSTEVFGGCDACPNSPSAWKLTHLQLFTQPAFLQHQMHV